MKVSAPNFKELVIFTSGTREKIRTAEPQRPRRLPKIKEKNHYPGIYFL